MIYYILVRSPQKPCPKYPPCHLENLESREMEFSPKFKIVRKSSIHLEHEENQYPYLTE
jgi:hypothetical protein